MNTIEYPKSYIVWDLETSGLDLHANHITEIGAIVVVDGEIKEQKNWILDNKITLSDEIQKLTGITYDLIKAEGRDPKECLSEFAPMFKECDYVNITHNGLRFDIPFFASFMSRILMLNEQRYEDIVAKLEAGSVDTAVMAKARKLGRKRRWNETFSEYGKRVMQEMAKGVKYNVGITCDELNIDRSVVTQHRALGDCMLTNEIYKKFTQADV